jgi:hypothetical protein
MEASFWKCRAFINISTIFEDFEIEAFLMNVREFQRLGGFLNTYLVDLRLF